MTYLPLTRALSLSLFHPRNRNLFLPSFWFSEHNKHLLLLGRLLQIFLVLIYKDGRLGLWNFLLLFSAVKDNCELFWRRLYFVPTPTRNFQKLLSLFFESQSIFSAKTRLFCFTFEKISRLKCAVIFISASVGKKNSIRNYKRYMPLVF